MDQALTSPCPQAAARPAFTVADVIRRHGPALLDRFRGALSAEQRRALSDLAACRTEALGGHVHRCAGCGHERLSYNSCRNRHCPTCQASYRASWLAREASWLLPVEYHHVVFTLPAEVADLALANPARLYGLLFRASWETLREVAADPRHLGAEVGVLAVLHTWGQTLSHHPHVHCVVTGGGLSCDRRGVVDAAPRWVSCRPGFFLPVRVLGRVFRGKFLALLRQAWQRQELSLPGRLSPLSSPEAFRSWLGGLYARDWVVHSKPPFGGPQVVLKYLARYVGRVALSNGRVRAVTAEGVSFSYKDYARGGKERLLALSGEEFLRRFLTHVLPKGFVKVRHYGLLASRVREEKLAWCRWQLALSGLRASAPASPVGEALPRSGVCPECGGAAWVRVAEVPRGGGEEGSCDTS